MVTLSRFIATEPCQWPLNTVPKEPDPILGPTIISSFGISQSSFESLQPPCKNQYNIIQLLTYVVLLNSKRHIDRRGAEVNMIKFTVQ